jgi:hypothetical protein
VTLSFEERIQRSSQAPADSSAPDCCKVIGALDVTTKDGERFVGKCRVCGRHHYRAFPDLSSLNMVTNAVPTTIARRVELRALSTSTVTSVEKR